MSIHLDPKWRSELQRLVDAGEFGNLDEAVNEAVGHFLTDEIRLERLKLLVREAEDAGGEYTRAQIEADIDVWFGAGPPAQA